MSSEAPSAMRHLLVVLLLAGVTACSDPGGQPATSREPPGGVVAGNEDVTDQEHPADSNLETRQVGVGRAVVSVPVDWPIVGATCGRPKGDHVVWFSDARAVARCNSFDSPPGVQVGITTLDSAVAREFVLRQSPEQASAETIDPGLSCGIGHGYCTQSFGVPSENAFFLVTVKQANAAAALTSIRDSLQLLPDGFTTVPFIEPNTANGEAGNRLIAAGLKPELSEGRPAPSGRQPIGGTSPEAGSVVKVGSTVTMVLTDESTTPDPSVSTSPQAGQTLTRCARVTPPSGGFREGDFAVDPQRGTLGIHFSDTRNGRYRNVSYLIAYRSDPTCRTSAEVARLLDRIAPPGWDKVG